MSSANVNVLLELPETLPTATRCIQIQIPDDREYFALFYGALDTLTNWYSYDRDIAHTGAKVARLWQKALKSIRFCPPLTPSSGGGGVIIPMFRQNPANLCQLQVSFGNDPDTGLPCWCTIFDASLCQPNPAPGAGTTPPSAGQCTSYKLQFGANALTPLPFAVNSGDTLTISNLVGAGSDGSPNWFCPDGEHFVLGICGGGSSTLPGDPLPTVAHMKVLLLIGGTYHDFSSGTLIVPGGVTNQIPYLLVNDTSLSDNAGTYNIDFQYCNNQAVVGTWCHDGNFLVAPDGFVPPIRVQTGVCGTPTQSEGAWVSGTGWEGNHETDLGCTNPLRLALIRLDLGANVIITGGFLKGNIPAGYSASQINVVASTTPDFSAGNTTLANSTTESGAYNLAFATGPTTARYVQIYLQGNYASAPSGELDATEWKISGTGTAPPNVSNNC